MFLYSCLGTSPWDHCGVVYVKDKIPYIIDSGSFRYGPFSFRPLDFEDTDTHIWNTIGHGPQVVITSFSFFSL